MATLAGEIALVTGATRGLGRELALALAREGADVAVLGQDRARGQAVAGEIAALGRHSLAVAADVTDEADMALAIAAVADHFGRIDILVCAAGVGAPRQSVLAADAAGFHQVFDVNVLGVLLAAKHVLPGMMERRAGRVIAIGGTYGNKGVPLFALYSASKWALRGLIKSVALEMGPYDICANIVSPGGVDGPRLRAQFNVAAVRDGITPEDVERRFLADTALGRLSSADDIAAAVVFLAGQGARNVTGQEINVDGGSHA